MLTLEALAELAHNERLAIAPFLAHPVARAALLRVVGALLSILEEHLLAYGCLIALRIVVHALRATLRLTVRVVLKPLGLS